MVKTPGPPASLYLFAVLAFWGWGAGLPWLGPLLALVLMAPSRSPKRMDFSDRDFNRFVDLCVLLLLGSIAWAFSERSGGSPALPAASLLPASLFPLMAAQAWSRAGSVAMGSLAYHLRRAKTPLARRRLDLSWPYLAIALLAAGTTAGDSSIYLPGVAMLLFLGLWQGRERGHRPGRWGAWSILILVIAIPLASGLRHTQGAIEDQVVEWLSGHLADKDPFRRQTAMGRIGSLKASGRILFSVRAEHPPTEGWLLRDATYDTLMGTTWFAREAQFHDLAPSGAGDRWQLRNATAGQEHLDIDLPLRGGKGMLPLPAGTTTIEHLPAERLQLNPLGSLRTEGSPGLVRFQVDYGKDGDIGEAPSPRDLKLAGGDTAELRALAAAWGLEADKPRQAALRIAAHFARDFHYSLDLATVAEAPGSSPLVRFLTESRSGHCEYFASGAVLLLRAAGIPARYATGWAVREYSPFRGSYIVRQRHAHAWALYWDGRAWRTLDATPAAWFEFDHAFATAWQPLGDAWDYLAEKLREWRWLPGGPGGKTLIWLILPLAAYLAWSILRRHRLSAAPADPGFAPAIPSPFDALRAELEHDDPRGAGEPVGLWLRRLDLPAARLRELETLYHLHLRLRFGPQNGREETRKRLKERLSPNKRH